MLNFKFKSLTGIILDRGERMGTLRVRTVTGISLEDRDGELMNSFPDKLLPYLKSLVDKDEFVEILYVEKKSYNELEGIGNCREHEDKIDKNVKKFNSRIKKFSYKM